MKKIQPPEKIRPDQISLVSYRPFWGYQVDLPSLPLGCRSPNQLSFGDLEQTTIGIQGTGSSNTSPTTTEPPLRWARTPTTLHHLTPDVRYLSLYMSLFLLLCQLPSPDRTDTVLASCASTNICTRVPPHHPTSRARDIHLVEVKYSYTQRMSTSWDHSEYDPSRSPECPDS
ncbi:hypothetical protein TIFTF001_027879 [Ficus carica]|uniref:Uncharacterized protein n=1 Tax=Ficus carica TaxID=3494 RepID=A0AA88DP05_FICCA|nr:hypothetical protein TIFTF001_027879 [Ficus carica]